jgi:hypothetical protein
MLLVFAVTRSGAQQVDIAVARSYAANDTTAWVKLPSGDWTFVFYARDSVNVLLYIDYTNSVGEAATPVTSTERYKTWTVLADSTNSADSVGYFKGVQARRGATDNIPGGSRVRLRVVRKTTGNGVTTPSYDAYFIKQ